jgi:hypothetical protein
MRTLMTCLIMMLFCATNVHAQTQGALDKAKADSRSCMVMSDSMSTALALSDDQRKLVRKSDMQCLQACEKVGYRTTGNMDEAAMRAHARDMRTILTAIQYDRWSAMCVGPTQEEKNATEQDTLIVVPN